MIVCVGEALIDFIPEAAASGELTFTPRPGGSPYNTAIALARLGIKTAFLGKFSTDFFGDQLFENLEKNKVLTDYIVRTDEPSILAFVKREESGNARYAFYANGSASRSIMEYDLPVSFPEEVKAVAFGSISLALEPGAGTISMLAERESKNLALSLDPNIRPSMITDRETYLRRFEKWVSLSSIIKISDDDLSWIYPGVSLMEGAKRMLASGCSLVVVTQGEKGAFGLTASLAEKSADTFVPAPDVKVSDTIGAGDTFHGALLSFFHDRDLLSRESLSSLDRTVLTEALAFAGKAAGITCSRPGADPPFRNELLSIRT